MGWNGYVRGLESDGSIDVGGNLYANVVKEAVDHANRRPVEAVEIY